MRIIIAPDDSREVDADREPRCHAGVKMQTRPRARHYARGNRLGARTCCCFRIGMWSDILQSGEPTKTAERTVVSEKTVTHAPGFQPTTSNIHIQVAHQEARALRCARVKGDTVDAG